MALQEKRNAGELILMVGGLIDQNITSTSTPNMNEVIDWLNEASIKAFRFLPIDSIADAVVVVTAVGNKIIESDITGSLLRISFIRRNSVPCERIEDDRLKRLVISDPYAFTGDNPAYSVSKDSSGTSVSVFPSQAASLEMGYIPYPFQFNVNNLALRPTKDGLPVAFESFIVNYAAAVARMQDEEPGQFQLYMSELEKSLKFSDEIKTESIQGTAI